MRRLLLTLLLLGVCVTYAYAQITILGHICDQDSGEGVSDVNVMLQNDKRTILYGYAISYANGDYTVSYNGNAQTLQIVVTGFIIQGQSKSITAKSQRVDFNIEYSVLEIREVVVNARVGITAI